MRLEGLIKSWNDDRGFGFIQPTQGGQELFVHIKAFPRNAARPHEDQIVSFEVEIGAHGKKRATNVEFMKRSRPLSPRRVHQAARWGTPSLLTIPAFLALYGLVAMFWKVPKAVTVAYLGMSFACFILYRLDKSAAESAQRRTKESTLLLLGLLGGWPGAILAQQFLRHKTVKSSFRKAFWGTVCANVAGLVALSSPWVEAWRWLP